MACVEFFPTYTIQQIYKQVGVGVGVGMAFLQLLFPWPCFHNCILKLTVLMSCYNLQNNYLNPVIFISQSKHCSYAHVFSRSLEHVSGHSSVNLILIGVEA